MHWSSPLLIMGMHFSPVSQTNLNINHLQLTQNSTAKVLTGSKKSAHITCPTPLAPSPLQDPVQSPPSDLQSLKRPKLQLPEWPHHHPQTRAIPLASLLKRASEPFFIHRPSFKPFAVAHPCLNPIFTWSQSVLIYSIPFHFVAPQNPHLHSNIHL